MLSPWHRSQFDFAEKLKVPCCYECIDFLKTCSAASLEERMQFSKDKIANKYQTALRIYEMWTEKEASTVGVDLQTSINAGLSLGEEAYKRIKFRGFAYEVDGVITHLNQIAYILQIQSPKASEQVALHRYERVGSLIVPSSSVMKGSSFAQFKKIEV